MNVKKFDILYKWIPLFVKNLIYLINYCCPKATYTHQGATMWLFTKENMHIIY